jgi:dTMP kinase
MLKYHEAGLDMGWSTDPYESFRIFQGKIRDQYEKMVKPRGFTVIDATREIHEQQSEVRRIITQTIDLAAYRRPPIK